MFQVFDANEHSTSPSNGFIRFLFMHAPKQQQQQQQQQQQPQHRHATHIQ